jgi:hypothetical protein
MTFINSTETTDSDDFEFTASLGTSVNIVRKKKASAELFGDRGNAQDEQLFEHGERHIGNRRAA